MSDLQTLVDDLRARDADQTAARTEYDRILAGTPTPQEGERLRQLANRIGLHPQALLVDLAESSTRQIVDAMQQHGEAAEFLRQHGWREAESGMWSKDGGTQTQCDALKQQVMQVVRQSL